MSNSHYEIVLEELRIKKEKLASQYITELYNILRDEEHHSPEECRAKIESDCCDIWSKDTIRKYLPPEAKNKVKRKAGKISAEIRNKKVKVRMIKEKEANPLVVNLGSSSQTSALVDNANRTSSNNSKSNNDHGNSVEINPTENSSVCQKKQELRTIGELLDMEDACFSSLLSDRHNKEALEEREDLFLIDDKFVSNRSLLLPSELAKQIQSEVNAIGESEVIPEFDLEYNTNFISESLTEQSQLLISSLICYCLVVIEGILFCSS